MCCMWWKDQLEVRDPSFSSSALFLFLLISVSLSVSLLYRSRAFLLSCSLSLFSHLELVRVLCDAATEGEELIVSNRRHTVFVEEKLSCVPVCEQVTMMIMAMGENKGEGAYGTKMITS